MLQAVEMCLLQRLVDVEVKALAQRRLLRCRLRGVGTGPGDAPQRVQAALGPTAPVWAVYAAAAAPAAVTAGRLEGKRTVASEPTQLTLLWSNLIRAFFLFPVSDIKTLRLGPASHIS